MTASQSIYNQQILRLECAKLASTLYQDYGSFISAMKTITEFVMVGKDPIVAEVTPTSTDRCR